MVCSQPSVSPSTCFREDQETKERPSSLQVPLRLGEAVAVLAGVVLTSWDKALFPLLMPWMGSFFFGDAHPLTALIQGYGLLWCGQVMRPVGGWWMGRLADRRGYAESMSIGLIGVGVSTVFLALLPSYQQISFFSPLLFVLLRGAMNFFSAGETAIASAYLIERAAPSQRAFVAALPEAMVMVGIACAGSQIACYALFGMDGEQWRWLLLPMVGIAALGGVLRRRCLLAIGGDRSAGSKGPPPAQKANRPSISHWKQLALFLSLFMVCGFWKFSYEFSVYFMNGILPLVTELSREQAALLTSFALWMDFLLLLSFGWWARTTGATRMMAAASAALALVGCPLMMWALQDGSLPAVAAMRMVFIAIGVAFSAPLRLWMQEVTSGRRRCELIGIASGCANLLFSGSAALLFFLYRESTLWAVSLVPAIVGMITFPTVVWAPRLTLPSATNHRLPSATASRRAVG